MYTGVDFFSMLEYVISVLWIVQQIIQKEWNCFDQYFSYDKCLLVPLTDVLWGEHLLVPLTYLRMYHASVPPTVLIM